MKTTSAVIVSLSLALAVGLAQARMQAQADPHGHGKPPATGEAATPAAQDGATAAPAAPAGGAGMMDCAAMMQGGGMMHGNGAMMPGGGPMMQGGDGAMMHGGGAMMPGQAGAGMAGAGMQPGNPSMMMHGAMRCGEGMAMPMSGDVDKDFVAMMIMHHHQAIRMADVEIAHGKDEALKAMARKMREAQLAEIAKLEKHR